MILTGAEAPIRGHFLVDTQDPLAIRAYAWNQLIVRTCDNWFGIGLVDFLCEDIGRPIALRHEQNSIVVGRPRSRPVVALVQGEAADTLQ